MEATSPPTRSDLSEGDNNFTTEYPLPDEGNAFWFPTPEDMLNPSKINTAFYPIVITHAITFVFGIIGNVVAISVMVGDRKGRSATNMFLVSLAVADLLLLLLCVPLEVLLYFLQFDDNGVICKTARYTELLSATASVLNLCAVSLERFIVIVFPMRSRSVCTMSNCRKAVCFVWIVSMLLSLPVMLTEQGFSVTYYNNVTSVDVYYCKEKSVSEGLPIAIYKFVVLFAAPALLMMICYFYVIRELWRSTRTIKILTNANSKSVTGNNKANGKGVSESGGAGAGVAVSRKRIGILGRREKGVRNDSKEPSSPSQLQLNLIPSSHNDRSPSICSIRSSGDCIFTAPDSSVGNGENGNGKLPESVELELSTKCQQNHTNIRNGKGGKSGATQTRQNKADDPRKTRKQVIQMLILIILLFLICWGPKLILNITLKLAFIFGAPIFRPEIYTCRVIFALIPFVHSCINPIVYSFMSSTFRKKMSRQLGLCCTACGCKCVSFQVTKSTPATSSGLPPRSATRAKTTTLTLETPITAGNHSPKSSFELSGISQPQIEEVSAI